MRYSQMSFDTKMSQDVFQLWIDEMVAQYPWMISIHDDIVICSMTQEGHGVSLLNITRKESLVLNSKKLPTRRMAYCQICGRYKASWSLLILLPKSQCNCFFGVVTYMINFISQWATTWSFSVKCLERTLSTSLMSKQRQSSRRSSHYLSKP